MKKIFLVWVFILFAFVCKADYFQNPFHQVTGQFIENACRGNVNDLTDNSKVSFKIDIAQITKNIDVKNALKELSLPVIAFRLSIDEVAENALKTDISVLDFVNQQTYAFNLTLEELIQSVKKVDLSELSAVELNLADNF